MVFPEVEFGGQAWDGSYLGYKGSTVNFPETSGSFSVNESLALGAPKAMIIKTHAWLGGGLVTPEAVCSEGFLAKMQDAGAGTLPPKIGKFSFEFD